MGHIVDAKGHKIGRFTDGQRADVIPAQQFGPAAGGQGQGLAGREAVGPRLEAGPADPLQEHRLPGLAEHMVAIITGRAIDAQPDPHPGIEHLPHRGDTGGQNHIAAGAVADAAAGSGQPANLRRAGMNHMGKPDILPGPVEGLGIFDGPFAKLGQAEALLIQRFGQMSVQINQRIATGQLDRFPHQISGDAEGGAGGQTNSQHRQRGRIVKRLDDPLAIPQDVRLAVTNPVGG